MSGPAAEGSGTPQVLVLRAGWSEPTWRAQAARERLRGLSRRALRELAGEVGAPLSPYEKDAAGAPLPLDGWRWSVSHAGGFAAAALGRVVRLGVDVEALGRVPSAHVRERLAELGAQASTAEQWLAVWCRVEAALKACGQGLSALGTVRVEEGLVRVGDTAVMTRLFEIEGALLAVAGGGVCVMAAPRCLVDRGDAA